MVVKIMKWRPSSKKFVVKITVHQLRGLESSSQLQNSSRYSVEIKWKGSKGNALTSLRRSVRRNYTKEVSLGGDGVVEWREEFESVCSLSVYKDGVFNPWEVSFAVFNGVKEGSNNKVPVVATASLNLADFASEAEKQESEINIPLTICCDNSCNSSSLYLSIILLELKNTEEPSEPVPRSIFSFPRSPCYGEVFSPDKEELPNHKAVSKKVNIFSGLSAQRAKRTSHEEEVSDGRSSVRSEDFEFNCSLETESFDDSNEGESEEVRENLYVRKSFNYGSLAYANHAGASIYSNTSGSEDDDWIYYSHHKSDVGQTYPEATNASVPDQLSQQNSKRRLLPWRKRKLSFRSPKVKGEPLLKNYYGEEGGDDIDFDRRQFSSSDESTFEKQKTEEISVANQPSSSVFGDDNFAVGVWEHKEIVSRDGQKKLKTQVFFASIDQRSERAAGESACTALVAVVANWLQSNHDVMPIKSQFDSLIREGSLEWRNLYENEIYRERFPDKHFDLETVLEAKVRPLSVIPEKSFVGFFHPEGIEDKEGFEFLQGAMSFDNIWDEICQCTSENSPSSDPLLYIISWNDHFFVLKIEHDAYYIIDTLGERLYEGCNEAFILKFDRETILYLIDDESKKSDDKAENEEMKEGAATENKVVDSNDAPRSSNEESSIVCTGKESCKEYIKSFLAAIPIRELEVDLKKGLIASTPLHHRLQIEFHYTKCLHPVVECPTYDNTAAVLPSAAFESDGL